MALLIQRPEGHPLLWTRWEEWFQHPDKVQTYISIDTTILFMVWSWKAFALNHLGTLPVLGLVPQLWGKTGPDSRGAFLSFPSGHTFVGLFGSTRKYSSPYSFSELRPVFGRDSQHWTLDHLLLLSVHFIFLSVIPVFPYFQFFPIRMVTHCSSWKEIRMKKESCCPELVVD